MSPDRPGPPDRPAPAEPHAFAAPAAILAHARAFAASGAAPAAAKLASTVVLLRAGPSAGFECFAIRRATSMAFAGGLYAFPGGGVDPRDAAVQPAWAGASPAEWGRRLRLDEATARAVVCAAVREVFEECGVLLAGPDPDTVVGDVSDATWESARVALIAREVGFAELLTERGLVLRSDLLAPWSRWITPEFEPRRYDTYFFLAALPARQVTKITQSGEAESSVWAPAAELAGGAYPMLPPTTATLREVAACEDLATAWRVAAGRDPGVPVTPRLDEARGLFVV